MKNKPRTILAITVATSLIAFANADCNDDVNQMANHIEIHSSIMTRNGYVISKAPNHAYYTGSECLDSGATITECQWGKDEWQSTLIGFNYPIQ